ncbi:MAG: hypothetical protein PHY64_12160 [Eubacteriales bacterium]|nr:hypothetical protein [Eubacteriales bacterium]
MARELFQAVQTAEEDADQLLQNAQREARELIKTTQAEIVENERAVALEHRAMYQSILDEKRDSVKAKLAENRPAAQQAQEVILTEAKARLDQAAQRIFERVWNDGNR